MDEVVVLDGVGVAVPVAHEDVGGHQLDDRGAVGKATQSGPPFRAG